jgi:ankyrin repeat protein
MTHALPANPNIARLKKQAKKLLKSFQDNKHNDHLVTLQTIKTFHPKPELFSGLRDAQLVIARHYGCLDWADLNQEVELARIQACALGEQVDLFITSACVKYDSSDQPSSYQRANKLLALKPEIGSYNFYAAIVSNNLPAVTKYLKQDPHLATTAGGPLDWLPIMYATYSRINEEEGKKDAIAIVQILLAHGADANSAVVLNKTYHFSALTGAIGEGEGGFMRQPPHQFSQEIAELLLKAGANPNDSQALYNTMFENNSIDWLKRLMAYGLNASHTINWDQGKSAQTCFDFLLAYAAKKGNLEKVIFLLDHGASPNAIDSYNHRSAYSNALIMGHSDVANYLKQHGAQVNTLNDEDTFKHAIACNHIAEITTILQQRSDFISNTDFLDHAAQHSEFTTVNILLDSGFDVNGQSSNGQTLLHHYAWNNNIDACKTLVTLGADINTQDFSYQSTPLGFAIHNNSRETIIYLASLSNNIIDTVACANLMRTKELLDQSIDNLYARTPSGNTLLHIIGFALQGDANDDDCENILTLLIDSGLSINVPSNQGKTALAFAIEQDNEQMVDILKRRGAQAI